VTQPSVVVVGPGAIGTLLAVRLARLGCEVALLHRAAARAAALRRGGIRLEGPDGPVAMDLPVSGSAAALSPPAFLCLCVKAFDTRAALERARPLLAGGCTVVSFQNGLGNAEAAATIAGAGRVVCAATACGATRLADGVVREAGRGPTLVAPFVPAGAVAAERFCALLQEAGLEAAACPDAAAVLWSKLVVNAAINPVTALHSVPNGALLEQEDLRDMAASAARETAAVAGAAGVRLRFDDAAEEVRRVCAATAGNISSMLQDLRAGRRTEVEFINGAVVNEAQRYSVPAPVNTDLLARVLTLSASARSRAG
jgi:2-dehydropantoate 2-reductase